MFIGTTGKYVLNIKIRSKFIKFINISLISIAALSSPCLVKADYESLSSGSLNKLSNIKSSSYNLSSSYNNYYKIIYNMKNIYFTKKYSKFIKTKKDISKVLHNKKLILNIIKVSKTTNIPAKLIAAVIKVESNGDSKARSWCGNMGLMQISWDLSEKYKVNPWNIKGNITAGTKYLKYLSTKFSNKKQILEAYNAGPEFVYKYGDAGEPLVYAEKVLYYYHSMQG